MPPTREIDSNFYLREKNTEKLEAGTGLFKKKSQIDGVVLSVLFRNEWELVKRRKRMLRVAFLKSTFPAWQNIKKESS